MVVIVGFGSSVSDNKETKDDASVVADNKENKQEEVSNESEADDNVPTEYKSALKKAKSYSDSMHMSKAGLYDQLTSEYGEKFTQEEADYAIANLK